MRKNILRFSLLSLAAFSFVFFTASCGSDTKDDIEKEEQDMYEQFVTPEMEDVLVNTFGMSIHRGVTPPKVEGYFKATLYCEKSNVPYDTQPGSFISDYKMYFYNQRGLMIDLDTFETTVGSDWFKGQSVGKGTFISGTGDNFTIYLVQDVVYTGDRKHIILSLISGTIDRNTNGSIAGINGFQYALLMKENNGHTTLLENGQGRLFTHNHADVITKEQYETITGAPQSRGSQPAEDFVGLATAPIR